MSYLIMIIDDKEEQLKIVSNVVKEKLCYEVVECLSLNAAKNYFLIGEGRKPDLILYDGSKNSTQCDAITNLKLIAPQVPIVVLLSYGDYEMAASVLRAGAYDFLNKPIAIERLSTTLRNMLTLRDVRQESEWLRNERMRHSAEKIRGVTDNVPPYSLISDDGNIRRMDDLQEEAIRFAMQYYNGRITEVARRLGIGRSTLYRKLNDMGVKQTEVAA